MHDRGKVARVGTTELRQRRRRLLRLYHGSGGGAKRRAAPHGAGMRWRRWQPVQLPEDVGDQFVTHAECEVDVARVREDLRGRAGSAAAAVGMQGHAAQTRSIVHAP